MDWTTLTSTMQKFITVVATEHLVPLFITVGVVEWVKRCIPDRSSFRWEIPVVTIVIAVLAEWLWHGGKMSRVLVLNGVVVGLVAAGMYRVLFARIRDMVVSWRKAKKDIDGPKSKKEKPE